MGTAVNRITQPARTFLRTAAIEQSCKVKGVKPASFADAGRPIGGQNVVDGGMAMTVNVQSPKTGQWEEKLLLFPDPPKSFWW